MFNFQLLKRSVLNSSYKYLVCMILILTGVYISVFAYNTDFVINKADGFILKEIIKILIICGAVHLFSFSKAGFIAGFVMVVYTGICTGTYLMYLLNNTHLISFILSAVPVTVKLIGVMVIYADMFMFNFNKNNTKKLISGGVIYATGDMLSALFL